MDYFILLQAILYFCISASGFFVCIPVAVNRATFGGVCILYAEVRQVYHARIIYGNSSISSCDFPVYFGVFGMMILGFIGGFFFLYFAVKSRTDKDIGERMWTLPFITLNAVLAFVTMIAACILTVGFNVFCESLKNVSKHGGCEWFENRKLSTVSDTWLFVELSHLSEAGAWIGFLMYMIQTGLSMLRMYRSRLRQK